MSADLALFLAHAIALEQEAAERYAELADAMEVHNNPTIAALFRKLAEFSRLHQADVTRRAEATGVPLPHLKPWEYQWTDPEGPESTSFEDTHYKMTPFHCLSLALNNEKRGQAFYATAAAQATDPDVQRLGAEFADEENEHVRMLENWIAQTARPADNWDEDFDPPVVSD